MTLQQTTELLACEWAKVDNSLSFAQHADLLYAPMPADYAAKPRIHTSSSGDGQAKMIQEPRLRP